MTTFHGGVFSRDLPDGRAGAEITVTSGKIRARTRDGHDFELDSAHCRVELGGASGRMWFCRSSDGLVTLFSEDATMGTIILFTIPSTC